MDRDPGENYLDPVERVTPSTGENDTGTTDDQSAAEHRKRQDHGTEATPAKRSEPEAVEPPSAEPPIPPSDSNPRGS